MIGYQTLSGSKILSEEIKTGAKNFLKEIKGFAKNIMNSMNEEIADFNKTLNDFTKRQKSKKEELC